MPGIITLLDEDDAARVGALWDVMAREFAVAKGYPGSVPHFTYHLADSYDMEAAGRVAETIAAYWRPFTVEASGFGVFGGEQPILYIPVARNEELTAIHVAIAGGMEGAGMHTLPYDGPATWLPHITIAQQSVPEGAWGPLLAWCARQPLAWRIPVTNIAVADQAPDGVDIFARYALGGA